LSLSKPSARLLSGFDKLNQRGGLDQRVRGGFDKLNQRVVGSTGAWDEVGCPSDGKPRRHGPSLA
jgi:hypothetical protein